MPMKLRQLKALLRRHGYVSRPGKGSHSIWTHPGRPESQLVLYGADGQDAKPYQVARARKGGRHHVPPAPSRRQL